MGNFKLSIFNMPSAPGVEPLWTKGKEKEEQKRVRDVLWGEAANDPGGWVAKLNTYYKARKKGESFADVISSSGVLCF